MGSPGRRTVKAVVQRIGALQEQLFKGYDRRERRAFFTTLRTIESRLREMQEAPARRRIERRASAGEAGRRT